MKKLSEKLISIALVAVMLMSGLAIFAQNVQASTEKATVMAAHGVIRINSDEELAVVASSEGWAGDGSAGNPYVIENYDINGTGHGYCIYIGNTTVHFTIKNCSLHDANGYDISIYYNNVALSMYNVTNGLVVNNTFFSNDRSGISARASMKNLIENNTVSNGEYGIALAGGNNITVRNNTVSNASHGIYIFYSENDTIFNNSASDNYVGVYLENTENSNIEGNDLLSNALSGIQMVTSKFNTISDNKASNNNGRGIYLESSEQNSITNNTVNSNRESGIRLGSSSQNIIMNNTATGNRYGIYMESDVTNNTLDKNNASSNSNAGIFASVADGSTIRNNTVSFNRQNGIYIGSSPGLTISKNIIFDNAWAGIYLERNPTTNMTGNILTNDSIQFQPGQLSGWNTHTIDTTNTVNGKPVYYYNNQTGIVVPLDAGEVILANCSNILAAHLNLTGADIGMEIGFSSDITVSDNEISNNSIQNIFLTQVEGSRILNNSLGFSANGLYMESSSNDTVWNNTVFDNDDGLYLTSSSINNTISDNFILDNNGAGTGKGIHILAGSSNTKIINNTISGSDHGIDIDTSANQTIENNILTANHARAMNLYHCSNGTIAYNNMNGNQNGIFLRYSCNNSIFENNIVNTNAYALDIYDVANNNLIYHNYFANNSGLGGQARDLCDNFWNASYPYGGNYWSDYSGNDIFKGPNQDQQGQDGIGDTPYNAIADGTGQDNYPLMRPWNGTLPSDTEPPTITMSIPEADSPSPQVIGVSDSILIDFSEFLNQSSFTYTCTPDPGGWNETWRSTAMPGITLEHIDFDYNTNYTFTVTGGKDLSGKSLTNIPYAINFTTELDTISPVVYITSPAGNSFLNTTTVTTQWVGWDNETGIDHYDFSTDGHSWINNGLSTSITGSLLEGNNTLYVRAVDNSSNSAVATVNITIDTVDPELTISSPSDGDAIPSTSVTVWWNGSDTNSVTYEVRLDGMEWFFVEDTHYDFAELTQGNHTVDVRATDPAGNSNTDSVSFAVDTIKPIVSITSPEANHLFNTSSVTFTWNGWDNETDIEHYNVSINGGGTWSSVGSDTTYTAKNLSDGFCNFAVMAFDMAGNSNRSDITVSIDTTEPMLWMQSPSNGTAMNYTSISVTWAVLYSNYSEVSMDGGSWTYAGQNASMDFFNLSEGTHMVRVRAFDEAGNSNITESTFIIDLGSPFLNITYPSEASYVNTNYVNFTWTGGDNLSGIGSYQVKIDDYSWKNAGTKEHFSYVGGISNGIHTVYVLATDRAGNNLARNVTFLVDTFVPHITVNNPTENGFTNRTEITVNWTADDSSDYFDTSGLNHFEVSVNGGTAVNVGLATEYNITGLTEGLYKVTVTAFDNAGNHVNYTIGFTVDTLAPIVQILSPGPGFVTGDEITVNWSANGTGSLIVGYEVRLDNENWINVGSLVSKTFITSLSGEHTVYVRATDQAGNAGNPASLTYSVDMDGPDIIQYSPQGDNCSISSPISVTFSEEVNRTFTFFEVFAGHDYNGTLEWNGTTFTFTPDSDYPAGVSVHVQFGVTDVFGNYRYFHWVFNTSASGTPLVSGSGTVTGTVVDENGNPVVGAEIVYNGTVIGQTDENGNYSVELPAGDQTFTISKNGMSIDQQAHLAEGGALDLGETTLSIPSAGDNDSSASPMLYIILLVILLAIIGAALFMKKGKTEEVPAEETDKEQEPDDAEAETDDEERGEEETPESSEEPAED